MRVTVNGAKSYIFERRLFGRTVRLTIGDCLDWPIDGPAGSNRSARAEARRLATLIDQGIDPRQIKADQAAESKAESKRQSLTLADALKDYTEKKRRAKDGLPLKERTKTDYMNMVAKPRNLKLDDKKMTAAGPLYPLASKSIYGITADDIRKVFSGAMKRSERQAAYAMQVLRAVFNWHGVKVPDNPLSKDVAGRDRITIPQAKATGRPIPAERIGEWWRTLDRAANPVSRDYFRFLVLTGARVSEPKNIRVVDCDNIAGRVTLRDTKNRKDHVILLSRQAAEIVERNIAGKKGTDTLFNIADAKKTRATIIERSGTDFRAKDLRATFASIAGGLVTAYVLKAMMNHAGTGDVTATNYVRMGDDDLRAGWQAVADFIESKAAEAGRAATVADIAKAREKKKKSA